MPPSNFRYRQEHTDTYPSRNSLPTRGCFAQNKTKKCDILIHSQCYLNPCMVGKPWNRHVISSPPSQPSPCHVPRLTGGFQPCRTLQCAMIEDPLFHHTFAIQYAPLVTITIMDIPFTEIACCLRINMLRLCCANIQGHNFIGIFEFSLLRFLNLHGHQSGLFSYLQSRLLILSIRRL
jgi:hypothetical protein